VEDKKETEGREVIIITKTRIINSKQYSVIMMNDGDDNKINNDAA
jgi:hypothetical protein